MFLMIGTDRFIHSFTNGTYNASHDCCGHSRTEMFGLLAAASFKERKAVSCAALVKAVFSEHVMPELSIHFLIHVWCFGIVSLLL